MSSNLHLTTQRQPPSWYGLERDADKDKHYHVLTHSRLPSNHVTGSVAKNITLQPTGVTSGYWKAIRFTSGEINLSKSRQKLDKHPPKNRANGNTHSNDANGETSIFDRRASSQTVPSMPSRKLDASIIFNTPVKSASAKYANFAKAYDSCLIAANERTHISTSDNNDKESLPKHSGRRLNNRPFLSTATLSIVSEDTVALDKGFTNGGNVKRRSHVRNAKNPACAKCHVDSCKSRLLSTGADDIYKNPESAPLYRERTFDSQTAIDRSWDRASTSYEAQMRRMKKKEASVRRVHQLTSANNQTTSPGQEQLTTAASSSTPRTERIGSNDLSDSCAMSATSVYSEPLPYNHNAHHGHHNHNGDVAETLLHRQSTLLQRSPTKLERERTRIRTQYHNNTSEQSETKNYESNGHNSTTSHIHCRLPVIINQQESATSKATENQRNNENTRHHETEDVERYRRQFWGYRSPRGSTSGSSSNGDVIAEEDVIEDEDFMAGLYDKAVNVIDWYR